MRIDYTCPACDAEVKIDFEFGSPAIVSGPIELADPGSADEFSPENCPHCNFELDAGYVAALACDEAAEKEYADEARAERQLEEGYL
ncbi:hypothetical protein CCP2SC5_740008 [Azospirillaceae bacterium]